MTHDYTRKRGVVHTEILLPPHAPPSFSDRSTLWNSVELYEKAGNAQLAREIDAALPIELSREEQIRLVREYCSSQFVSRGMCVDFAIHDTDSGNPHCHIMLTMRPLDERGAWAAKSKKEYDLDENGERIRLPSGRYKTHKVDLTGWNDKGNALLWRKAWADISNAYLERAGHPERIDYRSNAERGIDELPTVHMGVWDKVSHTTCRPQGRLILWPGNPRRIGGFMAFFSSAITTLQTLVVALGAGLGVWGVVNLLEGYGSDNPGSKSQGIKQLMAGGGIILLGTTLIPVLSTLF